MDDDLAEITVCQGPPRCDLEGDEAIAAIEAGCPWCMKITVDPVTGEETRTEPASA
ncbi:MULTISPECIES: hypothetical protein [Hyphomicrobiales]|uniref:hypothetical protein n=1 Tax=Hyphomicrobiales TaxID=356 RepID=UPI0032668CF7